MRKAAASRPLALLGPQHRELTVAEALRALGVSGGTVATITAGWQERESDDEELTAAVGLPTNNLRLYERTERLFEEDPVLASGHRRRQQALRRLRALYDTRLAHAMATWRELADTGPADAIRVEAESAACETVRQVDTWHLDHVGRILSEFDEEFTPSRRKPVVRERKRLAAILADASALAVGGGHIAVLSNRLRLLGLGPLLEKQPALPLVAWSAGAMAIGSLIVLFHDSPPQGPGNAEVFGAGIGCYDDLVVFPDGSRRLRLDDPGRVGRLARRFAPRRCVLMDRGARLTRIGGKWAEDQVTGRLAATGRVEAAIP